MLQVAEASNGDQIKLPLGATFEVALSENRTTGFRWELTQRGEPACVLLNDRFARGSAVGQPGTHVWQFQAQRAGPAIIELCYVRSWEKDRPPARAFALRVEVGDPQGRERVS